MEYRCLNVQPEELLNGDAIYITNLQRKGQQINNTMDMFNIRCDQLQLYKTQLTKDLQNKPITLPFEIEDIKHQKQHTKYSARKHCEQKVPTQQVENINQQADEFRTNNIQYAVNGSILVKSMRGELLLTRNHDICSKSCMESSNVSMNTSSSSSSYGKEQSKSDSSMDAHSSSDRSSVDNSNEDNGDNGNDSDEETDSDSNSAMNLIISAQDSRIDLFEQFKQLDPEEQTYLDHFEHAYKCIESGPCELQQCKNPREITDFCDNIIKNNPRECELKQHDTFSKILIHHAIGCSRRTDVCNMLLCRHFEAITTELDSSTHVRAAEPYSVLHSNTSAISDDMKEGYDFSLMFVDLKGRGGFGDVFDACYYDNNGNRARVAVKKCKNTEKDCERIDHSVACMRRLGAFENILLPDVVLKNSETYLFLMQCAEMSLLSYIKTIVRAGKDLELNFCCFYFHQMAKGLSYCHQSGLVHGDIKPANAVLTSDFRVLKLIDWDFLKDANEVGSGSGSPGYAAPEVYKDVVEQGSDVYSLCRSLVPLLFGSENPLVVEAEQPKLYSAIHSKNKKLAEIYLSGTQVDRSKRPSVESISMKFRSDEELQQLLHSYQPIHPTPDAGTEEDEYHMCFRFFRNWMMRRLNDFADVIPEEEQIPVDAEDVVYQYMDISSSDGESGEDDQ